MTALLSDSEIGGDQGRIRGALAIAGSRLRRPSRAYLLISGLILVARAPTLTDRLLSLNEGIFLAQAARLTTLDAWLYPVLYRVETKSQVGLIPFRLAQLLGGAHAVLALRLACLLALLVGGWLLIAFSQRFWRQPGPGLAAAASWVAYSTLGPGYPLDLATVGDTFLGANLEYFQGPLVLGALYATVAGAGGRGTRPVRARWWVTTAGALAAGSWLIKGSTLVLVPVLLGSLIYLARTRCPPAPFRQIGGDSAWFLLGAAVPVAAVFGPYVRQSAASTELTWQMITVVAQYAAGAPPGGLRGVELVLGLPLGWWGLLLAARGRRLQRPGRLTTPARQVVRVVGWVAGALAMGCLPGWSYWYYLIGLIPLGTLAGVGWLTWARPGPLRRRSSTPPRHALWVSIYLLTLVPALPSWIQSWGADPYRAWAEARYDVPGVLAAIATRTRTTDAIWVYYHFLRA